MSKMHTHQSLQEKRTNSSLHPYLTRRNNDLHLPRVRTNWGKQTFIYQASKDWNNLDNDIKNRKS